ncbi:MAG TPA: efflux RND transporter periplasmic adaptor subunit [Ideonella sp.]|nr:efflux RND transporter periplasmic adaptor subunit [Ideonella sp.]
MQESIAFSYRLESAKPFARGRSPARATALLATLIFSAAGLLALSGCGKSAEAQGGPPPAAPVSVAPAVQRAIADSEEFSGRLEATEFVELRPRVGGTIDKLHFADGAMVKKGDLLFTIDPRPFEAELARAQSQLAAAKTRLELSRSELARAQKLLDQQAISKQEFDQLNSGSRTSLADQQTAEAAVRVAALNLDYTKVRSPINGRASRANITAGNLVNEQSLLTTIAGVARIHAYFDGSETTYLRLKAAKPGEKAPKVQMGLANEPGFPHAGQVDFVDNQLNPQTGAIRLRATFDNARGQFTPGLAARLRMEDNTPHDAVLVAERAIGTDQTKKYVYVVGADNKPQFREVKLGALIGGMRVVQGGGVKPGENVVVDGLQRVMPGMPVAPQVLKVDAQGMPIVPPPAPPGAPGKDAAKPEAKS